VPGPFRAAVGGLIVIVMHEMPMRRTARSMRSARPLDADDARLLAGRVRGAATAGVAHLAPLWQTPGT
jgi:hypothetical protein